MLPTVEVFGRTIGMYGVCAAVGLLLMLLCVSLLARRRAYNPDDVVVAALVSFVGVAVGAVLLYGITNIPVIAQIVEAYRAGRYTSLGDCLADIVQCFSGFVFYGGLFGGFVAYVLYCRHKRWDVAQMLDLFAVAVPLFHVFGRIGCFMGGCCYGVEADWGFVYTQAPAAQANGVTRVPIQLIEAGCNLALFAALLGLFLKDRLRGRLIGVYGVAYALIRFVDEFWRGDAYRGIWGPFSTSQWISIALLVVSVAYLVVRARRSKEPGEKNGAAHA